MRPRCNAQLEHVWTLPTSCDQDMRVCGSGCVRRLLLAQPLTKVSECYLHSPVAVVALLHVRR